MINPSKNMSSKICFYLLLPHSRFLLSTFTLDCDKVFCFCQKYTTSSCSLYHRLSKAKEFQSARIRTKWAQTSNKLFIKNTVETEMRPKSGHEQSRCCLFPISRLISSTYFSSGNPTLIRFTNPCHQMSLISERERVIQHLTIFVQLEDLLN